MPLADACLFLEREADRILKPRRVPTRLRPLWLYGQTDVIQQRPRGVIGIIGTWNYPLFLNGVQIVQALTAGNAVLWKPSEVAPRSAGVLVDLLRRAGLPSDLFGALESTREAGQVLANAAIDHLVFTGAAATGRRIAARLGERLVSSTMELSGCDAMFVLEDGDVQLAARAAWFGATMNRGQTCLAVRRCFVQRSIYQAMLDALRPFAEQAKPVRLALPFQVLEIDRLIADAIADGASLLVERLMAPTGHCTPAVVVNARPEMAICREAWFAPVFVVLPYDDIEAALEMNARCSYGLGASIFTLNVASGRALAPRINAGAVTINDVVVATAHPATPFGGVGDSGWGKTQGEAGLLEMTVAQVISKRAGTFRPHYDMVIGPTKASEHAMLLGLLQSGHSPTFWGRMRGWWRLLLAMMRG